MTSAGPTARATRGQRAAGLIVAAICLTVLCIAASLKPDPRGVETHAQLGLWPCGWYMASGFPCPTCGMTTAFAAAANRDLLGSLRTQPFGLLLSLSTAAAFWGGLHTAVFGSRLGTLGGTLLRPRWMTTALILLLAAWAYKAAVMRGW